MPVAEASLASVTPDFARIIAGEVPEKALKILQIEHPDYTTRKNSWHVLLDAFEGSGGFLDGSYLWPYPREDRGTQDSGFGARMHMARYHNYLETLVDLYVRFIWTQGVKRSSKNEEFNAWTQNIDGQNTTLDEHLKQLASVALVHGHGGTLVDKTSDPPEGQTKADETARVIASIFTALAIPDWRFDQDGLKAVKLIEQAEAPDLTEELPTGDQAIQYLLWSREGWARFDGTGRLMDADTPDLGLVPFVILRPKPSYLSQMLGRALVSNANVVRALFNRASEEDEVLRTQAFSLLTVEVPPDGNVADAKADLGNTIGTSKAIVVRGKTQYQTPDQTVAEGIRNNMAYLVREMYRAAHIRFQNDSLSRESGESIRLQFTELNEMLQGFANGLAQAEKEIARCWFAWTSPTPEAAQAAFEAAQVEAQYPDEFFLDDLIQELEAWAEGIRMDLGPTMNKRLKKKAVMRLEPTLPVEEREAIFKEIDGQSDEDLKGVPAMAPVDTGDPEGQGIRKAADQ